MSRSLSIRSWGLVASLGFTATLVSLLPTRVAFAQELKDELDALDDIPPDDLSGLNSGAKKSETAQKNSPPKETPPATDPLDQLPVDSLKSAEPAPEKTATATLPTETVPVDDAVESLGNSSDVGLENELRSLDDRTAPTVNPPVAALTGVESEPAGKVTNIDFRQLPDRVRLTVKGNRVSDFERELRSKRKQVILEIKNMSLSRSVLRRALDTGEFDGPVALVQAFDAKAGSMPIVKVLFQLRHFVDPTVMRTGNDLVVDFPIMTDSTIFNGKSPRQVTIPETFLTLNSKMTAEGRKINLAVKDAELQDVLNLISRTSGKNFILAGGLAAKVTLNVRNTPWDEALRIILVNAKLGYQKIGNVYRIAPLNDLRQEIDESAVSSQKAEDMVPLETRLYALSYAKAKDANTNIADFKTKRGKSSVDLRTNTLVVTDIPETLERVARYVKKIDRQTAQILIEGRVVEAKKSVVEQLNVNWGFGITGGALSGSRINIGSTSTIANNGIYSGRLGGWGAIRAVLAAQEDENNVRTIASPRILALDNESAEIQQGDSFPIATAGSATTAGGITYVDATLHLQVTPQVTSDGFVLMKIDLKRDTPDGNQGRIAKRQAKTQVLVESGKTVVLGGIYTSDNNSSVSGLPWFRNLPVLGALFRNNMTNSEITNELLMFISPKIMNPDKAFLANVQKDEMDEDNSAQTKPLSSKAGEQVADDLF